MTITSDIKKIAAEFSTAAREGHLETYLDGILTVGEIEEIARRIEIVKLLKEKVPHHEIASRLGVGVATVTRGSKELKAGKFGKI